jgi:hypothetical protein
VHVLAEHERHAVDEVGHRGRRDEDADAALLGQDEFAGGRGRGLGWLGLRSNIATSSTTTAAIAAVAGGARGDDLSAQSAVATRAIWRRSSMTQDSAPPPPVAYGNCGTRMHLRRGRDRPGRYSNAVNDCTSRL